MKESRKRKDRREDREVRRAPRCAVCDKEGHAVLACPQRTRFICRQRGHLQKDCQKKRCNWCAEEGHLISKCPARKGRPKRSSQNSEASETEQTVLSTDPTAQSETRCGGTSATSRGIWASVVSNEGQVAGECSLDAYEGSLFR